MIKRISDFLAGLPATIAAGVFLLMDLIPHLATEFGIAKAKKPPDFQAAF